MQWLYKLSDIDLDAGDIESVTRVLESRWLSCGPVTADFEKSLAAFLGAEDAAALSSGTAALHTAMRCCGIGAGDEVLVPSLTFVATANCVLYAGATPVFCDVRSPMDPTISPQDIERKITPRTRAIIVMHYGGYPCDMHAILSIARKHGLVVIEDAAHAIGSKADGRMLGTLGDVGCFSFFANKNLPCGEGGALVARDPKIVSRARTMRSHAMTTATWDRDRGHAFSYDVTELGYNYRITELQAALATRQLEKLSTHNAARRELVMHYRYQLEKEAAICIPFTRCSGVFAYHLFPILLEDAINREAFMGEMRKRGIQTSVHYPPIHRFSYYREALDTSAVALPTTEHVAKTEVTLPLHPLLTHQAIDNICSAVRSSLGTLYGARGKSVSSSRGEEALV